MEQVKSNPLLGAKKLPNTSYHLFDDFKFK